MDKCVGQNEERETKIASKNENMFWNRSFASEKGYYIVFSLDTELTRKIA